MTPVARIRERPRITNPTKTEFVVAFDWSEAGVDRPVTFSIIVNKRSVAERLVAATAAGAVFRDPRVVTDRFGKTYVTAHSNVWKYANADLTRLGF